MQHTPEPHRMPSGAAQHDPPRRDTVVILNRPRLTFTAHSASIERLLHELTATGHIGGVITQSGVFWEQCMQRAVLQVLHAEARGAIPPISYILFTDFDTVFDVAQVLELRRLLDAHPEIDALFPVQAARHWDQPLLHDPTRACDGPLTDMALGHFGCTLIRRSVFSLDREPQKRAARLPWFWSLPNPKGLWDEGRVDPDIYFWNSLRNNGGRIAQANEIVVGHLELAVMWPEFARDAASGGRSVSTRWQRLNDFDRAGPPAEL